MKKLRTIYDLDQVEKGSVVAIGNFDGVHLGHQQLIKTAHQLAEQRATQLIVLTFEPHPLAVLHPDKAPEILTPWPLKRRLLADLGVDCRLVLEANPHNLSLTAEQFTQQFLVERLRPSVVVEGEDFYFGAGRTGNVQTLRRMAPRAGFEVVVVESQKIAIPNGQTVRVSSTLIRYMLASGRVADAAMALGRPYRLIGRICSGHGRGRQIGFPTLNMARPSQLIPAEGVYAGYVQLADAEQDLCTRTALIPAVFSIGQARTFGDEHPLLIEAHLLVDNADRLAGTYMAMDFVEFIRRQHKFASVDELVQQITRDCQKAKRLLKSPASVDPWPR